MRIEKRVPLAPLNTFGIGGKARYFCRVKTYEDLARAIEFSQEEKVPFWILGGGSNVLVSDKGFSGLVIKIEMLGIEFIESGTSVTVVASAGEVWDELVRLSVERGLHGLENLSGIPGTVGGAPVQNIGAYGVEVADSIQWVEVFDAKKGAVRRVSHAQCKFAYRDSVFKSKGGMNFVILKVAFSLSKKGALTLSYRDVKEYLGENVPKEPTLAEVRAAILEIRSRKFPDLELVGTAGSFFKNPIVSEAKYKALIGHYPGLPSFDMGNGKRKLSLAWIIDHVCKLKNLRFGDVGVAPRQTLVICNFGNAKARDVEKLAADISASVFAFTKIKIEPEVRFVSSNE